MSRLVGILESPKTRKTMNTHIQIDKEEAIRPLTLREKTGVQLLLIIFRIIYPARYEHEVKNALAPLYEVLEKK